MTAPTNDSDLSVPDEDLPPDVRMVEITREPVELYKILKFEGMANSGGQAKAVVGSGLVLVNGKVETQKRKKIVNGDTIEFNGEKIAIKLALAEPEEFQAEDVLVEDVLPEAVLLVDIPAEPSVTPEALGEISNENETVAEDVEKNAS